MSCNGKTYKKPLNATQFAGVSISPAAVGSRQSVLSRNCFYVPTWTLCSYSCPTGSSVGTLI